MVRYVISGYVSLGQVSPCEERLDKVRTGYSWLGLVRSAYDMLGEYF